jgi:hypothetical protein
LGAGANGEDVGGISPQIIARLTAVFFLLTIGLGVTAEMGIGAQLVVPGDAAATADRFRSQGQLVRLAFSFYLVEMLCQVVMVGLFYTLLRPAGRTLARLAVLFGVTGIAIKTMSRLLFIAPLTILGGAEYLGAFSPEQRDSMALLSIGLNGQGAGMALAFFGAETLLHGSLILRSGFLPRFLGVIVLVSGAGWLTFISPTLGMRLFPLVAGIGLLGSVTMISWLLFKGVDEPKWRQRLARGALDR